MNGTENMNKKLFWRCIVVSLIWSFVLVAIDCISNSRYFLSFLLLWTSNFLVVLLPPLLYRYKWRTFPTRVGILGTCVVLVLNKSIAFLAGMGGSGIREAVYWDRHLLCFLGCSLGYSGLVDSPARRQAAGWIREISLDGNFTAAAGGIKVGRN